MGRKRRLSWLGRLYRLCITQGYDAWQSRVQVSGLLPSGLGLRFLLHQASQDAPAALDLGKYIAIIYQ